MADIDLDAIKARANRVAVYAAPWTVHYVSASDRYMVLYATDDPNAGLVATVPDYGMELAEFIAAARTDVPDLVKALEEARYERRLLGMARRVLDLVADGERHGYDAGYIRHQAADVAQRIVDEIGHPVTDEPALGPSLRAEVDRLTAERTSLLADLTRWLDGADIGGDPAYGVALLARQRDYAVERIETLTAELAQARAVGRCGDHAPRIFRDDCVPPTCELPAGHAGWHREGRAEWSGPPRDAEAERDAMRPIVDAARELRQHTGDPDADWEPTGAEPASALAFNTLMAAVDAYTAAKERTDAQ